MEEKSMETTKSFVTSWDTCAVEFLSQEYVILRLANRVNESSKLVHVQLLAKEQTIAGLLLIFRFAGVLVQAIVMPDGRVSVNSQLPQNYGSGQAHKTIIPAESTLCTQESFIPSQRLRSDDELALNSPLAGRVLTVMVCAGQLVKKNQPLLTIESMKMENEICAPYDAIIKTLLIKPGDLVQPKQRLITFFLGEGVSNATPAHGHEQKEVSHR